MQGGMQSKEDRAAAAPAPTKAPAASSPTPGGAPAPAATDYPDLIAPSRAAHTSPADSLDALPASPSVDTAHILTERSENVLDSPIAGSPRNVGLHRRAKGDAGPVSSHSANVDEVAR